MHVHAYSRVARHLRAYLSRRCGLHSGMTPHVVISGLFEDYSRHMDLMERERLRYAALVTLAGIDAPVHAASGPGDAPVDVDAGFRLAAAYVANFGPFTPAAADLWAAARVVRSALAAGVSGLNDAAASAPAPALLPPGSPWRHLLGATAPTAPPRRSINQTAPPRRSISQGGCDPPLPPARA